MSISRVSFAVILMAMMNVTSADSVGKSNLDIINSVYSPPPSNLFSVMAPDIEWVEMAGSPYGGVFVGADGVGANVFANFEKEWNGFHPEPDQFIESRDTVVVSGVYKGVYKATGKPVVARFAHIYTLKNGKIIKFEQFTDTHLFQEAMTP
jgi:ketosteroid isomerase-like protein